MSIISSLLYTNLHPFYIFFYHAIYVKLEPRVHFMLPPKASKLFSQTTPIEALNIKAFNGLGIIERTVRWIQFVCKGFERKLSSFD
jgi:hypothetical protein